MTSLFTLQELQRYIPLVGNLRLKSPIAYELTRATTKVFNWVQLAGAKAYINGLEVPDSVLQLILNTSIPILYKYFPSLVVPYEWVLQESEPLAEGSQELMNVQYDLPEELFRVMLGDGKLLYPKYSMALWEKGAVTLEQAQMHMLDDLIDKVGIQDGDRLLDLGCGWGCAANYILSKFPNVQVTGLNLSHEQCNYIRKRMHDPDSYLSSGRFTLFEEDFNQACFETKFDKIVTIGVFEHVGNLTKSFKRLASFLNNNGKVFIHIISIHMPHNGSNPFLNKYIFPHGRIWNYDAVPICNQDLKTIKQWYLDGFNYSRTLKDWLKNFDKNQEKVQGLNYGMDYSQFRRIWRLYLLLCIAYFDACEGNVLGNGQYLMVHT